MFEVNVTGVFMTSKAVAKQMIRFGNGGSIALIASMSGTIANRVRSHLTFDLASIRISRPLCLYEPRVSRNLSRSRHSGFLFMSLVATLH